MCISYNYDYLYFDHCSSTLILVIYDNTYFNILSPYFQREKRKVTDNLTDWRKMRGIVRQIS